MPGSSGNARIAPTPSGFLHEGNLANFLLNQRLAGAGGSLHLRIDDLDRSRTREAYLKDIFDKLRVLDIHPDSGPVTVAEFTDRWSQQHRLSVYHAHLDRLRGNPVIYACPCSRRELLAGEHKYACKEGHLSFDQPGVAWRVNVAALPPAVVVPDLKQEAFNVKLVDTVGDFIIRTKAGRPSYQLACTVDDVLDGITRVGRGQDLLGSTAAQAVLSDLLGFPPLFERIDFLHHPLVTNPNQEKLSKSAGAAAAPLQLTEDDAARLNALAESWMR